MELFDFVLGPTVPITPPRVEEVATSEAYQSANMLALRNTCIANLLGFCGLTLPAGLDAAGMPVGLHLMAPPAQEALVLAARLACEPVRGPAIERPGPPPRCACRPPLSKTRHTTVLPPR